jgi:hypothetical protein
VVLLQALLWGVGQLIVGLRFVVVDARGLTVGRIFARGDAQVADALLAVLAKRAWLLTA